MWFNAPCRSSNNPTLHWAKLAQVVHHLPESVWQAQHHIKEKLAPGRPTQSIFLRDIAGQDFRRKLAAGLITPEDITHHVTGGSELEAAIQAVLPSLLEDYPAGGLICRMQLARLPAGASIQQHHDSSYLLRLCHRIHLPLLTESGVQFSIAGQDFYFPAGIGVELNNRVSHGAEHHGTQDRVHLILDYLPPEHNHARWLSDCHSAFLFRTSLEERAPTLVASSVIRGAQKHESHGGIYTVNFETGDVHQCVDWDHCHIDFQGRGWDRGLRGIAFFGKEVWVLASDELYQFNPRFQILNSFRSPCLKHAHEMSIHNGNLYVTSTGFDAILRFNLATCRFDLGWQIRRAGKQLNISVIDPRQPAQPSNTLHINQVKATARGLFIAGKNFPRILRLQPEKKALEVYANIPMGTHNARPFYGGLLFNDTARDRLIYTDRENTVSVTVPRYAESMLEHADLESTLARQGFARGLYALNKETIFVGSSPSTLSHINLATGKVEKSINISRDIRNAIHGLNIWSMN